MKQKVLQILFVITMTAAVSQTAFCQQDTIVVKTEQFDELLHQVAYGQATARTLDTLRSFYKEAVARYDSSQQNVIALLNERDAASKYIVSLKASLSAANDRATATEAKYQTVYRKRNKAFGIGLQSGYDPFRKQVYVGAGVSLNIIRFSLRGLFADGQGVEVPDPNIRVIR